MVEEGKEEKEKKEGNRHRECDIHLIAGVSSRKTYRVRGRSAFCASHLMSGLLASSVNLSVCSFLEIGFGRVCFL